MEVIMRLKPKNVDLSRSCIYCLHYRSTKITEKNGQINIQEGSFCDAFPEGIPDNVWNNGHFKKIKGQKKDLIFTER